MKCCSGSRSWTFCVVVIAASVLAARVGASAEAAGEVTTASYASIQEAIDAHPGEMIRVPSGRHVITAPLRISSDDTGLYGFGTIVQENAEAPIIVVEGARGVRLESLTLTRGKDRKETNEDGILAQDCAGLRVTGVRVVDNHSRAAGIRLDHCIDGTIRDCEIRNYKRIAVDDRTDNELQGYAFRCIDGSGIVVSRSQGISIDRNRIIDDVLLPTQEVMQSHRLGELTEGRRPTRLGELGRRAVTGNRVTNWHQGSAIVVTSPTESRHNIIHGNHIENAAQGVDLHCDQTICSGNVIHRCMIGLKATHGSRNLLLTGNLITHVDLWGIVVNPGANSSVARAAENGQPAQPENVDGGLIISNNIISDFGDGNEYWNWGGRHDDRGSSYGIALLAPQLTSNPPLRDVLVQGNTVYDTTRDNAPGDTGTVRARPKYRYAIYIEQGTPRHEGLRIVDNILHSGDSGVSNVPLDSQE